MKAILLKKFPARNPRGQRQSRRDLPARDARG